jgi:hypothetical protein
MAYLRAGIDGGRQGSSLVRNRIMDIRGDLATGGRLVLSTTEPSVVDGNELGRIDFQAPLDTAGTDAILVAAAIWAEADATFSSSVNATELVFATGASETAAEKMRIASDGNVGIGVTGPASLLHVAGTVQVGVDDTGHDVKFFGATSGKSLLWDESADSLIVTGTTTLVGTTNLDAVDIDGVTQIDAAVTVGVNDTGHDVKFFGATAGKSLVWDESADELIITGKLSVKEGSFMQNSTHQSLFLGY